MSNNAVTFNDVLIQPKFSTVKSRKDVDLTSKLTENLELKLPIISANMATITEEKMSEAMQKAGGMSILHRFCSIERNVEMFKNCSGNVGVSIGITEGEKDRAKALLGAGATIFCVDVAHGAQQGVVDQVTWLRAQKEGLIIIAGNFGNGESIHDFNRAFEKEEDRPDLYKVGIGPGCFAENTRILMEDGSYKNIQDIKIHDKIINKNGCAVEVKGVRFSGLREVMKYKNNLFYDDTYATPDHRHWIGDYSNISNINKTTLKKVLDKKTKSGKSKYEWKALEECSDVTLLLPKQINFNLQQNFQIDLNEYALSRRDFKNGFKLHTGIDSSYGLGYLIGSFLGDGCATIYKNENRKGRRNTSSSLKWYFGLKERHIATKTAQLIKEIFECNAIIKEVKNMIIVECRSNSLTRFFYQFGKKKNKNLPIKFRALSKEYNKGLLEGLIDSDGYIESTGRIVFTNTSKHLIEAFMFSFFIVHGYYPSSLKTKKSVGNLIGTDIKNISQGFKSRSVQNPELNQTEDYQINRINKLEYTKLVIPTYDIEVDCETHSFIANNAIVHNSACTTRLKTGVGVPQLSAIGDCHRVVPGKVIADGGIKYPGDVAKALLQGAVAVMIGGVLAGTDETPDIEAPCLKHEGRKIYKGSASEGYGNGWKTSEGVEFSVPVKGPVEPILKDFEGGLRSSFTYVGAANLKEFNEKGSLIIISPSTVLENQAHGKSD